MQFTTYILYSREIDNFYTGSTSILMKDRLKKHLSKHKGFTNRAKDWKIVFEKVFESKDKAVELEFRIKKRGAKRYLQDNEIDWNSKFYDSK